MAIYVIKPLRYIREKRPTAYLKDNGIERAFAHPDYEDAFAAAKRGDGATVQKIAQRIFAENQVA